MRSEVRRLRLVDLEQVRHHEDGQEWVPHWHDEWSFGAVVEGSCRCSVGGRPFLAEAGDLIAIAPGVVHTGALSAPTHGGVLVVMLYVPPAWLAHVGLTPPAGSTRVPEPSVARAARSLTSVDEVHDWLQRALPPLTAAASTAASSTAAAHPSDGEPQPTDAVRAVLHRVQAAVRDGELTVAGVARHCGVSRERLHRVLVRWLGMTPRDYLRAVRLLRARQLVLAGEPIASVAAECGFSDQAHFTRWFRRVFGYTPGDLALATDTPRWSPADRRLPPTPAAALP